MPVSIFVKHDSTLILLIFSLTRKGKVHNIFGFRRGQEWFRPDFNDNFDFLE